MGLESDKYGWNNCCAHVLETSNDLALSVIFVVLDGDSANESLPLEDASVTAKSYENTVIILPGNFDSSIIDYKCIACVIW
jgi:hypothetical protein